MGDDIRSCTEVNNSRTGLWKKVDEIFPVLESDRLNDKTDEPFNWHSYPLFAFLADVRNDYGCSPIALPRGVPPEWEDPAEWDGLGFSHSWLLLQELLDFDYSQTFWNQAWVDVTQHPGGWSCEDYQGKLVTYREHLEPAFFETLEILKALGEPQAVRVVFWFY